MISKEERGAFVLLLVACCCELRGGGSGEDNKDSGFEVKVAQS